MRRYGDAGLSSWAVLLTGSAIAFSLAGLFTRLIHLDAWTMIARRGIFSAVGIAAAILVMERTDAWRKFRGLGLPGWLYGILGAVCMILYIGALELTTVAHVAVIYATVPLFAALLGWFLLREAPSTTAVLASLAALAGVALMVGFGKGDLTGDAFALLMTAGMAAIIVVARRFRGIPVMPPACVSALMSGLACCPLAHLTALSASDVLLLISFGIVNSALGLVLFMLGAQLLSPIETAFIVSVIRRPPAGKHLGWIRCPPDSEVDTEWRRRAERGSVVEREASTSASGLSRRRWRLARR